MSEDVKELIVKATKALVTIAVDPCTCGGVTYGSSCVIECPYEQTAADCKAGQTFTQRCKDNNGTWFGECKQTNFNSTKEKSPQFIIVRAFSLAIM